MSRLQNLAQKPLGLWQLLQRPLKAYDAAAKAHPLRVGIITTVLKTSAADIFAQKVRAGADSCGCDINARTSWLTLPASGTPSEG